MFFRKHARVIHVNSGELVTKQEMKAECDINNIIKQYQKTGIFSHISAQRPVYEDLPNNFDYQQALHTVMTAEDSFATLPSVVRDFYQNNPERFLAALSDPSQRARLTEWGVFEKPVEPTARASQDPAPPTPRQAAQKPPAAPTPAAE